MGRGKKTGRSMKNMQGDTDNELKTERPPLDEAEQDDIRQQAAEHVEYRRKEKGRGEVGAGNGKQPASQIPKPKADKASAASQSPAPTMDHSAVSAQPEPTEFSSNASLTSAALEQAVASSTRESDDQATRAQKDGREIKRLESVKEDLHNKLEARDSKIAELEDNVKTVKARNDFHYNLYEKIVRRYEEAESAEKAWKLQEIQLDEKAKRDNDALQTANAQLKDAQSSVQHLTSEIRDLLGEKNKLEEVRDQLRTKNATLRNAQDGLVKHNFELEGDLRIVNDKNEEIFGSVVKGLSVPEQYVHIKRIVEDELPRQDSHDSLRSMLSENDGFEGLRAYKAQHNRRIASGKSLDEEAPGFDEDYESTSEVEDANEPSDDTVVIDGNQLQVAGEAMQSDEATTSEEDFQAEEPQPEEMRSEETVLAPKTPEMIIADKPQFTKNLYNDASTSPMTQPRHKDVSKQQLTTNLYDGVSTAPQDIPKQQFTTNLYDDVSTSPEAHHQPKDVSQQQFTTNLYPGVSTSPKAQPKKAAKDSADLSTQTIDSGSFEPRYSTDLDPKSKEDMEEHVLSLLKAQPLPEPLDPKLEMDINNEFYTVLHGLPRDDRPPATIWPVPKPVSEVIPVPGHIINDTNAPASRVSPWYKIMFGIMLFLTGSSLLGSFCLALHRETTLWSDANDLSYDRAMGHSYEPMPKWLVLGVKQMFEGEYTAVRPAVQHVPYG